MWISLSRHQTPHHPAMSPLHPASGKVASSSARFFPETTAQYLAPPLPPPGGASTDSKEKNRRQTSASPNPPSGQPPSSGVVENALRSDSRRSFRLVGQAKEPDGRHGDGLLPRWQEDTPWYHRGPSEAWAAPSEGNGFNHHSKDAPTAFDVRWASLRGKNKRRLSCTAQERPQGWEDVDQDANKRRSNSKARLSLRPSFVIKDVGECVPCKEVPPSLDLRIPSGGGPGKAFGSDVFDLKDIADRVDSMLPGDNLLQSHESSGSTTNVAPNSACNSPSENPSHHSSIVADRHLWSSTDSFICEDFMFSERRRCFNDSAHEGMLQSLRSYSQIFLNQMNLEAEAGTSDSTLADPPAYDRSPSPPITPPRLSPSDSQEASGGTSETLRIRERSPSQSPFQDRFEPPQELSSEVSAVNRTPSPRPHWITFDSSDNLNHACQTPTTDSSSAEEKPGALSPAESDAHQGMLPKEHHGSTANLMEPSLEQPQDHYQERFVRSYSRRSRRASKRVINSVSRRMNPSEYGKMREPVPPMFSKAALTMQTGPGLFEVQPQSPDNEDVIREEYTTFSVTEPHVPSFSFSSSAAAAAAAAASATDERERPTTPRISLTPSLPSRVGSLRLPKMPSALVRRSVSFAGPKMESGEIKFQRLPDQRGSFRRAMSGLGALARSFRRGKNSSSRTCEEGGGERGGGEGGGEGGEGRGGGGGGKRESRDQNSSQVPQAPRLPRKAIARSPPDVNSHTSDLGVQV